MDMKSAARRERKVKVGVAAVKESVARAGRRNAAGSGKGKEVKAEKKSAVAVKNARGVGQEAKIGDLEAVIEVHNGYWLDTIAMDEVIVGLMIQIWFVNIFKVCRLLKDFAVLFPYCGAQALSYPPCVLSGVKPSRFRCIYTTVS